jgi:flagellar biosynthesis/type III secretory pathway protein FliH
LYDKLSEEEKRGYDHHLSQTRYEQNVIEDARSSGLFEGKAIGLEEGEAIGLEKGEAIGLEKGRTEEKINLVLNSYQAGLPVETISTITGLAQKEIMHILESVK